MISLDVRKVKKRQGVPSLRKVQYGRYEQRSRDRHPVIRLGGKYLESCGFMIGDIIEVWLETHQITIMKVNRTPSNREPTPSATTIH